MKDEVEKLREQQLTDIWRPLFDPKIHPQEMAMLIRQCKDESNALFQTAQIEAVRAARIDELNRTIDYFYDENRESKTVLRAFKAQRIAELTKEDGETK